MNINKRNIPKEYFYKSWRKSTFFLVLLWLGLLACLTLIVQLDLLVLNILCFFCIGVFLYHLNILGHEGIHYLLYEKRKINDLISRYMIHSPQFAPLSLLRSNHMNHHAVLGTESDKDTQYYDVSRFSSPSLFVLWIVLSFLGWMVLGIVLKLSGLKKSSGSQKAIKKTSRGLIADIVSLVVFHGVLFSVLYLWSGSVLTYFLYWFLPAFSVMFGLNVLRSCLEHAVETESNEKAKLMTFRPRWMEALILSPYNMNYHSEHHMFPSVPCWNLPRFSAFLETKEVKLEVHSSYFDRMKTILKNRWD